LYILDKQLVLKKHFLNQSDNEFSLSSNNIRSITEDKSGNIIIATFDGISLYSPEKDSFVKIKNQSGKNERFSHFSFHSVYIDSNATLWGGTWAGGVNYGNPDWKGNTFRVLNPYPQKSHQGIIGPLIAELNGMWIGIEGSGFVRYDFDTKLYKHFSLPNGNGNNFRTNIVTAFCKDASSLFVGTNNGLIAVFDRTSEKIKKIFRVPGERSVMSMAAVGDGSILVGSTGEKSLLYFDQNGNFIDKFQDIENKIISFEFVRSIAKIADNEFIILTNRYGYYQYNLETRACRFISLVQYSNSPNDAINCLFRDRNLQLWLGTSENGLYRMDTQGNLLNHFTYPDYLESNIINAISDDEEGNIWFSQLNNLARYDIKTGKIKNYTFFDVNEFSSRSALFTNNCLFFGGDKGLIAFEPSKLNRKNRIPSLVINRFYINNQSVEPKQINFRNQEFTLSYNQSNILIDYTALEYFFQKEIRYAYKLNGFDKSWNYAGNNLRAYYTNLPAGKYSFLLKASSNEGEWTTEKEMMRFIVQPPPWKSKWAYLLYAIVIFALFSIFIRYLKMELKLKNDIILEKEKQAHLKKLHGDRMMLFTNLSHELRTPLSLIIAPLESLMEDRNMIEARIQNSLNIALKNAKRLLFITNELLDFRKKESGTIELKVAVGNFSLFVHEIVTAFSPLAEQRHIKLIYEGKDDGIYLWYDHFWMEKVLFNLLSNAFKYTPEGGTIEVLSKVQDAHYILNIKDSGTGIPGDQLEAIFEPFHQVRQDGNHSNGTGIGLSLVKGIIGLHNGTITAENNETSGASFTIQLYLDRTHFSDEQIIENCQNSENISNYSFPEDENLIDNPIPPESGKPKKTVLLIEDNKDLRTYLQLILQRYYHVLSASNGIDGLVTAMNHIPDLVLSDIMMPKMNGIELCRKLKTGSKTSHIPVILLTAMASAVQIQEGLDIGADDYVIKPFNLNILISKINNLLSSRDQLKNIYGKTFGEEIVKSATTNVEKDFINKLYAIIESELSNPDFSTKILCERMGMSKTGLYTKVKELTGLAPSELIKKIRMDLALQMLTESQVSVTEIANKLGFSSLSYLSSSFKSVYKLSPSEYLKQNKKMKTLQVNYLEELNVKTIIETAQYLDNHLPFHVIDTLNWPLQFPYKPECKFKIVRSKDKLYIKFYVVEKNIKAVFDQDQSPVYQDSCVEFFCKLPDQTMYFNFEFNCIGTCFAVHRKSRTENLNPLSNIQLAQIERLSSLGKQTFAEKSGKFEWNLTVSIPLNLIGAENAGTLSANFYKCGDKTGEPHYLSWNPIISEQPDFHRPEFFGEVKLLS
jgi:signal transduction histidine kinase/AraC-like DNA-binding protein/streptogramin lyase